MHMNVTKLSLASMVILQVKSHQNVQVLSLSSLLILVFELISDSVQQTCSSTVSNSEVVETLAIGSRRITIKTL